MTPAQQFIARVKLGDLGTPAKRLPPNVANPQSAPCTIDFAKLERERAQQIAMEEAAGVTRKPLWPPRIW